MSDFSGKTIGQYQLIEQINESTSTLVFKAFQPALNRYVAIKLLKPGSARQPDMVQRFRQQAELLTRVRHPRTLEVFETGEEAGLIFSAMRLAENGSLLNQLALGPQSPFLQSNRTTLLFQEIVEGLGYLHSLGFVHGNIKPGNILLDEMFHALLSDFGVPAKSGAEVSPFLAPEQVQGGVVDRRADVYALGVLLFTTLVGEAPPPGVVVSLRSRRPDLPEAVDRVIFKAMAQNPDQRFQSAAEFFTAMRSAFLAPQPAPQPAYTPPPAPPAAMPTVTQTVNVSNQKSGPNWLAIIVGVLVVLALCIGGIYVYQQYFQNGEVTPAAPTQPAAQPTQLPPIIIMPTQPPGVTEVLPTREPRPTDAPPEQPTQPPDQPKVAQPIATPGQGGGSLLPCGSALLILAPMAVIGVGRLKKKSNS